MKQRRRHPKRPDAPPAPRPGRRWLFRLAALVLAPLAALGLLESGLRLAGYGYDTAFFKKVRIGGRDFLVNNDDFARRFFPPQLMRLPEAVRMEAEKPPGVCRIFVLGESAALGDPNPAFGAGRYLRALLSERFPGRSFEVVNVAMTAINSHALLPMARECARRQGDVWIIYMGNNEMVGPFGAASVFGAQAPPRWSVRLSLALQQWRAGQWLMALTRGLAGPRSGAASWGGMQMFLGHQIAPGDARKERVYGNFRDNLRQMVRCGLDSGARVILNTVAVNLKDCPPFASLAATNLGSASAAWEQGKFDQAARLFAQAAPLWPHSAQLEYGWAQCLLALTNLAAAQDQFQKACDDDTLPFRADSRINRLIRETAGEWAGPNLVLCDAAAPATLGEPATAVLGGEVFYEHIHFNFEGNYRLGRAWAEKIEPLLAPDIRQGAASRNWASEQTCERRLALTDWNRALTLGEVIRRRKQPPLSSQDNNAADLEELGRQLADARRRMDAAAAAQARALYQEDIQREPEDYLLRFNYADFLEGIGDTGEALAQWRQVETLLPEYYLGYVQEGRMLEREGQLDQAAAGFGRALALYPRMTVAWFELSNIHASQGKYAEALRECERASGLEPEEAVFYACQGRLLSHLNNRAGALEKYRKSIQIQPGYFDGHLALAEELTAAGRDNEAAAEFGTAVRLRPDSARARLEFGQALLRQGQRDDARQQFEETLRLEPGNLAARQYLNQP